MKSTVYVLRLVVSHKLTLQNKHSSIEGVKDNIFVSCLKNDKKCLIRFQQVKIRYDIYTQATLSILLIEAQCKGQKWEVILETCEVRPTEIRIINVVIFNLLSTIRNSLEKQRSLYKVVLNPHINYMGLWELMTPHGVIGQ